MTRRISGLAIGAVFALTISGCSATSGGGASEDDVTKTVMQWDNSMDKQCKQRKVVHTEKIQAPAGMSRVERWTVNRCGKPVKYRIDYPSKGGFSVHPENY